MSPGPLFITAEECRQLIDPDDVVRQVEQVLTWDAAGEIQWPTPRSLNIAPDRWGNDYHVKACVLEAIPVAGLRLVSHPLDESSPICTRFILLIDPRTSLPLALIDETWNYAQRTVASIALAARRLANPDAAVLAVVGAGRLARTAIDYYRRAFDLREVRIAARRAESREGLAADLSGGGIPARATESIEQAVSGADLVLTATSATTALLEDGWIAPGAVVACVGTAEPGREFAEHADLFVVDSPEQLRKELVAEFGDDAPAWVDASVGQVVSGAHPGRTDRSQRVLIITEGMASQDIAIAHLTWQRAVERQLGAVLPHAASLAAAGASA